MNIKSKPARLIQALIFCTTLFSSLQVWTTPEESLKSFLREKVRDTIESICQYSAYYANYHTFSWGDPKELKKITQAAENGCRNADIIQQARHMLAPQTKKQYDHTNACNDFKRALIFYNQMSASPFIQKRLFGNLEQQAVIAIFSSELSGYESEALVIENTPEVECKKSPSGHYYTDSDNGRILLLNRPPNKQDAQRLRTMLASREQAFVESGILKKIQKKSS